MDAAQMIYQFSIVSFFCSIMVTPYIALVIAHEDMNIYASISVIEALLKLGIVVFLRFIPVDKLQLYGILICIATFVNTVMYRIICKIKYHECKFYFYWNQELFKEIMSYTGWNLFGTVAALLKNQAVNILLNQFFNPAVIAARSISSNVNSAVSSFSLNFSIVMRPQIIKSYALGKKEEMLSLMFSSAKGTYLLMYIFTLPLVLEIPIVLSIWLKNPPEYTILFTRLTLVDVLIDSISYPVMAAIHATGKIKLYQFVVGSILLLNLPLSWIALLLHVPSYSVIIIGICLTCITSIIRFFMLKRLVDYSIFYFFKKILLPMGIVSVLSAMLPLLVHSFLEQSILRLCIIIVVSMISTCICIYFIGLNKTERIYIKTQLKKKLI
jgi:O-antigen/teichoic acid export membrane protein